MLLLICTYMSQWFDLVSDTDVKNKHIVSQ